MMNHNRNDRPFLDLRRHTIALVALAFTIFGFTETRLEAAEFFVAVDHQNASDSNDGLSVDSPFKTLNRAVQELSPGDTLSIEEGIYREPLQLGVDGAPGNPVVIQAYPGDEGNVVVRGSDVVGGWAPEGGDVWSVPWQPLPLIDFPSGWPHMTEYAQRREMVFVNGNRLEQVLVQEDLDSGRFWMDDAAQRLRIHHPGDPNVDQVEVSVRNRGAYARGRTHIVIRGLRVDHISPDIWIGAMSLGPGVRVEDCWVEHNNGVGIEAYSGSEIIRTVSNHNGLLGIGLAGDNSLLDSCETSYNSWRYEWWAAGGIKVVDGALGSNNHFVRHTAKFNNGAGIAFDSVGPGNIVESSVFEGNLRAAIIFEAMDGPNWVINNLIIRTNKQEEDHTLDGVGVLIDCALDTYIYNNTIVDVEGSGVAIRGGSRNDGVHYNANSQVYNNIIASPGQSAIQFKVWGLSLEVQNRESHVFDNNLYLGGDPTIAYPWGNWTLAEWQANRGEDLNSLAEDPGFVSPVVDDYSLSGTSPAIDAGRDLVNVTEDITGRPRPLGVQHDMGAYECPLGTGCGGLVFLSGFETGDLSDWTLSSS